MSGVGRAHCAVDEQLDLDADFPADGFRFGDGHLTPENQSRCAHLLPEAGAPRIQAGGLGGKVDGNPGVFLDDGHHAQIGDDHRINGNLLKEADELRKPHEVGIVEEGVERDVDLAALLVRVGNRLRQFVIGKVVRAAAEAKLRTRTIDRIRAIKQGNPQFLEVSGRCEEFHV